MENTMKKLLLTLLLILCLALPKNVLAASITIPMDSVFHAAYCNGVLLTFAQLLKQYGGNVFADYAEEMDEAQLRYDHYMSAYFPDLSWTMQGSVSKIFKRARREGSYEDIPLKEKVASSIKKCADQCAADSGCATACLNGEYQALEKKPATYQKISNCLAEKANLPF